MKKVIKIISLFILISLNSIAAMTQEGITVEKGVIIHIWGDHAIYSKDRSVVIVQCRQFGSDKTEIPMTLLGVRKADDQTQYDAYQVWTDFGTITKYNDTFDCPEAHQCALRSKDDSALGDTIGPRPHSAATVEFKYSNVISNYKYVVVEEQSKVRGNNPTTIEGPMPTLKHEENTYFLLCTNKQYEPTSWSSISKEAYLKEAAPIVSRSTKPIITTPNSSSLPVWGAGLATAAGTAYSLNIMHNIKKVNAQIAAEIKAHKKSEYLDMLYAQRKRLYALLIASGGASAAFLILTGYLFRNNKTLP